MASGYQCLDQVIAVGNYVNRNQYITYDNVLRTDSARIPGSLIISSGRGPTRDGRIKPDITSPGDWTLSALPITRLAPELAAGNSYLIAKGGYHSIDGGTSSAAPGIAGIAALYLQMNPTASWQNVKNAIINCARKDIFTGANLPDNNWGSGKADAFASLIGCSTSINNIQNSDLELLIIYPNPAFDEINFDINLSEKNQNPELVIYDLAGKKLKTIKVKNSDRIMLRKGALQNGIYFCSLRNGESIFATKKLILSK